MMVRSVFPNHVLHHLPIACVGGGPSYCSKLSNRDSIMDAAPMGRGGGGEGRGEEEGGEGRRKEGNIITLVQTSPATSMTDYQWGFLHVLCQHSDKDNIPSRLVTAS